MVIDPNSLLKNTMTEEILNGHGVKVYFSGNKKEIGGKFALGMLLVPDYREDLEIIFDFCDKDIQEGYYSLEYVKRSGKLSLGYFKLEKTNDTILNNISTSLDLTKTEESLLELKRKIHKEIEIRNNKKKK